MFLFLYSFHLVLYHTWLLSYFFARMLHVITIILSILKISWFNHMTEHGFSLHMVLNAGKQNRHIVWLCWLFGERSMVLNAGKQNRHIVWLCWLFGERSMVLNAGKQNRHIVWLRWLFDERSILSNISYSVTVCIQTTPSRTFDNVD